MTISLTRAAWIGAKRYTDDDTLKLRIDGLLLLSRADRPSCDLPTPLLALLVDAYGRWARSHGLAP
jgi:hypothetical protein